MPEKKEVSQPAAPIPPPAKVQDIVPKVAEEPKPAVIPQPAQPAIVPGVVQLINPAVPAPIRPVVRPEVKKVPAGFGGLPVNEADVANLMDMGFPHETVVQALQAAYNNLERATEYLITVSLRTINRARDFQHHTLLPLQAMLQVLDLS